MRHPNSTEKYNNLFESTLGAATGLFNAIRTEKKIRLVFLSMVIVTGICVGSDVGYFQILMVIFSWVVALICEMFNTALEKVLDHASQQYHPLIRQAKDYAAACTFVALVFAFSLAIFICWDRYTGGSYPRAKAYRDRPVVPSENNPSLIN